jgi:hypothetical protein
VCPFVCGSQHGICRGGGGPSGRFRWAIATHNLGEMHGGGGILVR